MHEHDDSQSRRTNILVGNEVLTKLDDSQNVTHQNGVAKIEVTKVSNPLNIGQTQLIYDGNLSYQHHAETTPRQLATLADVANATVDLSVLPETVKMGSTFVMGNIPGQLLVSAEAESWRTVAYEGHLHNDEMACMIALFPAGCAPNYWQNCDGSTIARNTPAGERLVEMACPYGLGDGTTTVNVPTITASAGCDYKMFVGAV